MDKLTKTVPEIEAFYEQLAVIAEDKNIFNTLGEKYKTTVVKCLFFVAIWSVASIVTVIIGDYFDLFVFKVISLCCLIVAWAGLCYYSKEDFKNIKSFFTTPFKESIKTRLKPLSQYLGKHLPTIQQYTLATLKLAKASLELEHNNFPKRCGMVVGAIETIGFLPAILALIVAISTIGNTSIWIYGFIICYLFFVILGLIVQHEAMRYSQLIKLIDLAMLEKNKEAK